MLQATDSFHKKLVEIGGEYAVKSNALEQRSSRINRFVQNPIVELKPRHFPIQEFLGRAFAINHFRGGVVATVFARSTTTLSRGRRTNLFAGDFSRRGDFAPGCRFRHAPSVFLSQLYSNRVMLIASPAVMAQSTEIATWWGRHRLPPDRADLWAIGSLQILVEHFEASWRLHWRHVAETPVKSSTDAAARRTLGISREQVAQFLGNPRPASAISPHFGAKVHSVTIPSSNPNEDLIFSPILPEESLIMSLGAAAVLDPGEKLSMGFQIPLSVRVETVSGQKASREACEIPLAPMIRTWGGTTPLSGELALTPDTPLYVERWSDLKPRLDVAGVAVSIINRGSDSVFIDRILIPSSRLSLFHSPQTGFWCDSLVLEPHSDEGGITSISKTERTFPREAGATTLVMNARQAVSESTAMKGLASFRSTIGTSVENLFKERG
jgi:hypothetical protein